eukprot:7840148-Pyramimonas_sp.AAC.1
MLAAGQGCSSSGGAWISGWMQPCADQKSSLSLLPLDHGYIESVVSGGQWPRRMRWGAMLSDGP